MHGLARAYSPALRSFMVRMTTVIALFALLALPAVASANEGSPFSDPAIGALLLPVAQCALAESGGHAPDVVAITWVLWKRARQAGVPISVMAQRYCRIHRDARPHRRWILEIGWTDHPPAPPSWAGKASWQRLAHIWHNVQLLVLMAYSEQYADPCPAAFHWGSDSDGQPRLTQPVSCGATRNRFWSRPRRSQKI